ncbi:MAG: ribosome silencing factor [Aggregatilineales bacterium]
MDTLEFARFIVDVVEENKADNIVLLDLRPDTVIADFFVVCTGNSERQIRALSDYVRTEVKDTHHKLPYSSEGTPASGWVLVDYGDVVVHIFSKEQREYYSLESLWSEVSNVLLNIQ